MNTFFKTLGLAAALPALALFAGQVRAQDDATPPQSDNAQAQADSNTPGNTNVSFQTFYDQLANQGTWVQTDKYGYVFQPTENDPNWRPYTYGHWVNTDEGMTWASDESFGWATYHYGRWANLDGYGWVWVPGYTWAPAWVSWRDGGDDVGWAPLPPDSDVGIDFYDDGGFFADLGFGFHIGDDCDVAYGIGPWCYNFCPVAYIGDRDAWRHFRDHRDNFALIGHTRNVTNINFHRDGAGQFGRVHADGPSVAALNARSRTPIQQARLTAATSPATAGLHGNTLAAFAPRIDPSTMKTARPGAVTGTLADTRVNRGTDINRPLTVNSRISPAGATAAQIHAATLAQGSMPANAKVATANTNVSRPLTQPLTSLRTDTRSTSGPGTGSRPNAFTGTTHASTPSVSAESRYTGEPVTRHTTNPSRSESTFVGIPITRAPSSAESAFTGAPVTRHTAIPSNTESAFTGAPATRHTAAPSISGGSIFHPQAQVFHSSAPAYHPQQSFQSSAPVFHSSAPAYHPQTSFRSFAPAPQPHFSAPAATHFSGGSFGGGRPSGGGGGAVHASAGGGQPGNNQRH